jgi:hypothetical protein
VSLKRCDLFGWLRSLIFCIGRIVGSLLQIEFCKTLAMKTTPVVLTVKTMTLLIDEIITTLRFWFVSECSFLKLHLIWLQSIFPLQQSWVCFNEHVLYPLNTANRILERYEDSWVFQKNWRSPRCVGVAFTRAATSGLSRSLSQSLLGNCAVCDRVVNFFISIRWLFCCVSVSREPPAHWLSIVECVIFE